MKKEKFRPAIGDAEGRGENMGRLTRILTRILFCFVLQDHEWTCAAEQGGKPTKVQLLGGMAGFLDYAMMYCKRCGRVSNLSLTMRRLLMPEPISIHDHGNCELCDQLEREKAILRRRIEVKAEEDALWIHLHGDSKEGAVNLSEVGGPITKQAIHEVWAALRGELKPGV